MEYVTLNNFAIFLIGVYLCERFKLFFFFENVPEKAFDEVRLFIRFATHEICIFRFTR